MLAPTLAAGDPLGLAGEVGVAGGALDVGMAQELADHGEALAGGERTACVRMPEIVDADVVEAGAGAEPVPLGGDGGEVGARLLADDDPGVGGDAADACQHGLGGGCEGDHARARLAVAEPKLACGAVHVVPAEGQDLVQAAACEHEEAERGDGVGGDRALSPRLGFCFCQGLA